MVMALPKSCAPTGKAKRVIWRWQERFRDEGAAGLWRDKTRPSRIPPLSPAVAERVVAMTLAGPPPAASHWTGAAMAKAAGISVSSVQRIWRAHGLRPHLVRRFLLSDDRSSPPSSRRSVVCTIRPTPPLVRSMRKANPALDRTSRGADEKGSGWHHDPRIQASRRHLAVRTRSTAKRKVRPMVEAHRLRRHPLLPLSTLVPMKKVRVMSAILALKASKVLDWIDKNPRFVFHSTRRALASRRRFSCPSRQKAAIRARRMPIPAGTQRGHRPLPRRHQRKPNALYLDQGPQPNRRSRQTRRDSSGSRTLSTPAGRRWCNALIRCR